jgi:N4-gp56 family major capsid protein
MWLYDAPSGVYKNHALSSQIREQAAADALFAQFLEPERGFGKGKGATVTIHRVLQLPLAGKVNEQDNLPTGYAAIQKVSKSVSEWGFAIELTSFEEDLAFFDLRNKQQRMLRDQMTLTMDKMSADALMGTPVCGTATSASALTMQTALSAGTLPTATAASNLTIAHLRQLHDYFRQTLKCPKFRNNRYVGILSTRGARGIKNDPEYKDWLAPTTSGPLMDGVLRDVEGFLLYETNHADALDDDIGTAGVCGEGVFFGADAGFFATVQDPELRVGLSTDLGRKRQIGWVGTIEAGLVWDLSSTARCIRIQSAAV